MNNQIIVTIDAAGRPTIEAVGFAGHGCKAATKPIEDAFKGAALETVDKPELHHLPALGGEVNHMPF